VNDEQNALKIIRALTLQNDELRVALRDVAIWAENALADPTGGNVYRLEKIVKRARSARGEAQEGEE
jgi:hypothetical protein